MMTEDQATAKACHRFDISFFETGDPRSPCAASACMAWRWSRAKETQAYLDAVQELMKSSGVNFNIASNKVWAETGSTFEQTEGYCGLAGKP